MAICSDTSWEVQRDGSASIKTRPTAGSCSILRMVDAVHLARRRYYTTRVDQHVRHLRGVHPILFSYGSFLLLLHAPLLSFFLFIFIFILFFSSLLQPTTNLYDTVLEYSIFIYTHIISCFLEAFLESSRSLC